MYHLGWQKERRKTDIIKWVWMLKCVQLTDSMLSRLVMFTWTPVLCSGRWWAPGLSPWRPAAPGWAVSPCATAQLIHKDLCSSKFRHISYYSLTATELVKEGNNWKMAIWIILSLHGWSFQILSSGVEVCLPVADESSGLTVPMFHCGPLQCQEIADHYTCCSLLKS